jgi:hypothetical protein
MEPHVRYETSRTREDGSVHSADGVYTRFVCLVPGCDNPTGNYLAKESNARTSATKHHKRYHEEATNAS